MKKISNVLFIVLIIIVTSACSLNSNASNSLNANTSNSLNSNAANTQPLKVEDIASLQVLGGLPGRAGSPLYQNTKETGKTIISKIVGWINASKPVDGQTEYGKHGYPMVINLKMNDGKMIIAEPAYNCVSKTNADGSGSKSCTSVEGEIVLSNDSSNMRAESPELYEWLSEGWKKEN
jgi:uncharacterized membrane protein